MRTTISMLLVMLATGCTDDDATRNAAQSIGLRNVSPGGYAFFGCGRDDQYAQQFTAININGARVSGVVCCGLLKACTVRF
jgi:hypothetical protein